MKLGRRGGLYGRGRGVRRFGRTVVFDNFFGESDAFVEPRFQHFATDPRNVMNGSGRGQREIYGGVRFAGRGFVRRRRRTRHEFEVAPFSRHPPMTDYASVVVVVVGGGEKRKSPYVEEAYLVLAA